MQDCTFRVAANSNGIQCLKQCDSKCLETFDAKRKLQGAPFSTQVQQVHQHSSAVIKEKCAGLWRTQGFAVNFGGACALVDGA